MISRRVFTAFGLAALAAPLALAQSRPTVARGTFRYAHAPGAPADLQSLDLYPAPNRHAPLVVFIHGGGWRIGDKQNGAAGPEKAAFFNPLGYAFASVNYRLSPNVQHPAHVEDVAAALAWLHDNAGAQNIDQAFDPSRIHIMGHSAGAHLAALVAIDPRYLGRHGKSLSLVKGVIVLDGAGYDMTRQAPAVIARGGFLGQMYSGAFGADPAGWRDASPTLLVERGRGIAPYLIVHASRPDSASQSRALAARLREAGVDVRLYEARGYTHAQVNRRIGEPGEAVTREITDALARWGG